jgi:hypothetical protein
MTPQDVAEAMLATQTASKAAAVSASTMLMVLILCCIVS